MTQNTLRLCQGNLVSKKIDLTFATAFDLNKCLTQFKLLILHRMYSELSSIIITLGKLEQGATTTLHTKTAAYTCRQHTHKSSTTGQTEDKVYLYPMLKRAYGLYKMFLLIC